MPSPRGPGPCINDAQCSSSGQVSRATREPTARVTRPGTNPTRERQQHQTTREAPASRQPAHLGQRGVVEGARADRIQGQVELVLPAELKACERERVVAHRRRWVPLCEVRRVRRDLVRDHPLQRWARFTTKGSDHQNCCDHVCGHSAHGDGSGRDPRTCSFLRCRRVITSPLSAHHTTE